MAEVDIEKLKRRSVEGRVRSLQEVRMINDPVNKNNETRVEVRNIATSLKTDAEIDEREEEVQIIEELVTMLEKDKKMLPALGDVPKKKLLEDAAKVDKVFGRLLKLVRRLMR